ncbi:3-isopropylmalate dehydrogenase, partial [Virgibacillus sp. 7505]
KLDAVAKTMEKEIFATVEAGIKTGDLGGNASTSEFAEAIVSRINQ